MYSSMAYVCYSESSERVSKEYNTTPHHRCCRTDENYEICGNYGIDVLWQATYDYCSLVEQKKDAGVLFFFLRSP